MRKAISLLMAIMLVLGLSVNFTLAASNDGNNETENANIHECFDVFIDWADDVPVDEREQIAAEIKEAIEQYYENGVQFPRIFDESVTPEILEMLVTEYGLTICQDIDAKFIGNECICECDIDLNSLIWEEDETITREIHMLGDYIGKSYICISHWMAGTQCTVDVFDSYKCAMNGHSDKILNYLYTCVMKLH